MEKIQELILLKKYYTAITVRSYTNNTLSVEYVDNSHRLKSIVRSIDNYTDVLLKQLDTEANGK